MARSTLLFAALVFPLGLAACGGSDNDIGSDAGQPDASAFGCTAIFSGNFSDTVKTDSCASMGDPADGGIAGTLNVKLNSTVQGAPTVIAIDLGATAAAGTFSSETVDSWIATGINTNDCEFSAGNNSVPTGSFTLTLTSVGSGDAGPQGNLTVTQYVKAPPTVDCGAGDTEQIAVAF